LLFRRLPGAASHPHQHVNDAVIGPDANAPDAAVAEPPHRASHNLVARHRWAGVAGKPFDVGVVVAQGPETFALHVVPVDL
jgi:hypothetical protein